MTVNSPSQTWTMAAGYKIRPGKERPGSGRGGGGTLSAVRERRHHQPAAIRPNKTPAPAADSQPTGGAFPNGAPFRYGMMNTAPSSGRTIVKAIAVFFCAAAEALRLESRAPIRAIVDGGWTESGLPSASTFGGSSPNAFTALARLPIFLMVLIFDPVECVFSRRPIRCIAQSDVQKRVKFVTLSRELDRRSHPSQDGPTSRLVVRRSGSRLCLSALLVEPPCHLP